MVQALGWRGFPGAIGWWALPIVAAATVILIHHLGYWSCRNVILLPITLGLTVLTVGYLVTASWIAPALGHIFMHFVATIYGVEMPPHERPLAVSETSGSTLRAAA